MEFDGRRQREKCRRVRIGFDSHTIAGYGIDDNRVRAFAQKLGAPILHTILCLRGEANDQLAGTPSPHNLGENVFCGSQFQRNRTGALQLLIGNGNRAIIGHRGRLDHQCGFMQPRKNGVLHLFGSRHFDQLAMCRRMQRRGPADQNHLGASASRRIGQSIAHFSAGTVADKPDRIQRLARSPGSDEHNLTGQVMTMPHGAEHRVGDRFGLCHASGPHHAAGQRTRSRLDDLHATAAKRFKVGLRRGMLPHVHIHGWSHQDRGARCQIHRAQEIVGDAVGEFGQNVCSGRSHHQSIRRQRFVDVLDAVLFRGSCGRVCLVPKARNDFIARE